jgi:hypothetical protein
VPQARNQDHAAFGLRQRNVLYAFRIIQVTQETITALIQVGLGGCECGRREERQNTMEVLTEVPSSGLVCNICRGQLAIIKIPTKKPKLERPNFLLSSLETAVYFSCCFIHTYSMMLG